MKYVIGVDDHDSPIGGCTTHFSTLLINYFISNGIRVVDFPYLIRLNPNIPWKTRGNAAVRITVEFDGTKRELADLVWEKSLEYVNWFSRGLEFKRKPGIAVLEEERSDELYSIYVKAVSDVVTLDLAKRVAERSGAEVRGYRGIIGSLASIGFKGKVTYELITYRQEDYLDKDREVDEKSVTYFDELTFPKTFANYDYVKRKSLITPHGKDPVLYGIRGTSVTHLLLGLEVVKTKEPISDAMIFKSNQGTDAHLIRPGDKFYQTFRGLCTVEKSEVRRGGDVVISCNELHMIVYKETGELNLAAQLLKQGDQVEIVGAVKPSTELGKVIEAERIRVVSLNAYEYRNPRCPKCGGPSESLGKGKGFRCKKCGYKFQGEKVKVEIPRGLSLGTYQARYYRHLTKPIFLELGEEEKIEFEEVYKRLREILSSMNPKRRP
ncbi:MAG: hypothetical protein ASUL_04581 [Candidatus Aramenus sulfurataquae]|jgi:tRNA(Ile2)-agmatinylcytidine synthase|uniref:tRNA(Ile2) 2-agmatinylcytidine synthetase TiaS n=4 Tax=Candidatus Aramenus sulfurataquae TaxID=1326980 RepID=W7L6J0_9CREN|nr:MAG: hypothetical protein ASUL_04581 [Candidatus Aramenus sulfurataquae]MCL7343387.1 tRNA(Ile)(2)-agmatinylcytidine synthase [Candidatus Aramenus sulfurataquae]